MDHLSTVPSSQTASGRGSTAGLLALALGAFAIGTAELVIVGLLPLVAHDLAVSEARAGLLVTAYALGIAIGGPLLTVATGRLRRTRLVEVALLAFLAVNLVNCFATALVPLLAARAVSGALHGLFVGTAAIVASQLVPRERAGQAISMVFGGIAAATVLGVPLGTLVGETLGWRSAFVAIVALSGLAFLAVLRLVPEVAAGPGRTSGGSLRAALATPVLATLAFGLVVVGGQFLALTYLRDFLDDVTGITGSLSSAYLLAFGLAAAAGTILGGRAADRSAALTLLVGTATVAVALALLLWLGESPAITPVLLALWGLAGFGMLPALQLRVIGLAGAGADLASTLSASAVNAGIAIGAGVGGAILDADGARYDVVAALIVTAVAIPLAAGLRFVAPAEGGPEAANESA